MDIDKLEKKIRSGRGTFQDLHRVCTAYGEQFAEDVISQLNKDYPAGNVTEENARAIVRPLMKANYRRVTELASAVINATYKGAGVGLKAVIPEYNAYQEDDVVREIVEGSVTDES